MAIGIASVSSTYIAATGRSTVRSLSGAGAVSANRETGLPKGISARPGTGHRIVLNREQSQQLLSIAVVSATGVVEGLKQLQEAVRLAEFSSLTNVSADIYLDGNSRLSNLNLQVQANRLVERIDSLVAASAVGGANLLSSSTLPVRLQTTQFGGSVDSGALPLDSQGLNLKDLNLQDSTSIKDALGRIAVAITRAEDHRSVIAGLQRLVDGVSFSSQELSRATGGFGAGALPRGSLINLVG